MIPDLTTTYLGFDLAHPVLPSASPLTGDLDHIMALVEAGAPALVLCSLFEEQLEHDAEAVQRTMELGTAISGEVTDGFLPQLEMYNTGPQHYLDLVQRAKAETGLPVIASLNGVSPGGWTHYSRVLTDHGADALELNIHRVAAGIEQDSVEVETSYLRLVEEVRAAIEIPLAVKVGPYFTAFAAMARRLVEAGADALVLFNRFYQPDFDLEALGVKPSLALSSPEDLRLVLQWVAILHGRVEADLAATGGVHEAEDAVKAILAGATVTMMATGLLRHGPGHLTEVIDGVRRWLADRDYQSVDQARGSLCQQAVSDPNAFERANYMRTLTTYVPTW